MWKFFLANKGGTPVEANTDAGEDTGLVVATRPHKTFDTKTVFFTNPTYGREMAQDAAFGAVAWNVHDGTDNTEADSGTADTNTEDHIIQAAQNFVSTVCVGMTAHNTTDNSYAAVTVVNSNTDLTCDSDVCPDGNENYTIAPTWTFSEPTGTKWVEDSTDQAHAGSKSLKCDNATVGDVMQLLNVNGENVDMANFTAITMWIYSDKDWKAGDSVTLYAHVGGALAGNSVALEDYFDFDDYDLWQYINIPLSDMGIDALSIDALRFEQAAKEGGKAPKFYIDEITLQASGTAIDYTVEPDKGTWFHVKAFQTTFVDAHDDERANATLPNLSYNKILDMTPTVGYIYKRYSEGNADPEFEARITNLLDLLAFPYSTITNQMSDGTNTMITIENVYPTGMEFVLRAEDLDKLVFTLEDDFSQLLFFRVSVQGYVEQRE